MDLSRDLATVAAEDLVEAMLSGPWEPLSRVPELWRRGGATRRDEIAEQLDRSAARLLAAGAALAEVRAAEEEVWAARLYDLLGERPRAADGLYKIITEIGERRDGPRCPPQPGEVSTPVALDAPVPDAEPSATEPEPYPLSAGFVRSHSVLLTVLAAVIVVLTGVLVTLVITLRPTAPTAVSPLPAPAEVTLRAVTDTGAVPSRQALDRARSSLVVRLSAAGLGPARVRARYDRGELVIRLAHAPDDEILRSLVGPGHVSFRRVLWAQPALQPPSGLPSPPDRRNARPDPRTRQVRADAVRQKLGAAYDLAAPLAAQFEATGRMPDIVEQWDSRLEPFGRLAPDEVEVLPAAMQLVVPTVTCAQLNRRRTSVVNPDEPLVACDQSHEQSKYLLDVAKVVGSDVSTASAERYGGPDEWIVRITLAPSAQQRFTALTVEALKEQSCLAITTDQVVLDAPQVQAVIVGEIEFGSVPQASARRTVAQIKHHDLPFAFDLVKISRT